MLIARALHIIQGDLTGSVAEFIIQDLTTSEPHCPTGHLGIHLLKPVVTHSSPIFAILGNFENALILAVATYKARWNDNIGLRGGTYCRLEVKVDQAMLLQLLQ